jgi:hypothetical protein
MRPWLLRSHEGQVSLRCTVASSRRSDRESDRGFRATADPLRTIAITKAASSFVRFRWAGKQKNYTPIEFYG